MCESRKWGGERTSGLQSNQKGSCCNWRQGASCKFIVVVIMNATRVVTGILLAKYWWKQEAMRLHPAWLQDLPSHQHSGWHWGHTLVLYRLIGSENIWNCGVFLIPHYPSGQGKPCKLLLRSPHYCLYFNRKAVENVTGLPMPNPYLAFSFPHSLTQCFLKQSGQNLEKGPRPVYRTVCLGQWQPSSHSGGVNACWVSHFVELSKFICQRAEGMF